MCIIIYKPRGVPVDVETLRVCFENNPDGAGYMFPGDGRLVIKKGFFTFGDFLAAWEKTRALYDDGLPVVFHFRIATAGRIDATNCHPHRIARDLAFVHNGILSCVTVSKGGKLSDTILYRNRYLGTLSGASLSKGKLFQAIEHHIGTNNKFVFMNSAGDVVICNEEQGIWQVGLWFSNHSFLPRLPFQDGAWCCEYCGNILDTYEELFEGICRECLDRLEIDSVECGGCHARLFSTPHKTTGWCDDCGFDIYGRQWPGMLREAAALRSVGDVREWF